MTDREESGLRGSIRNCCTERDYVYPDRQWVMKTDDAFTPSGYLIQRLHRNPNGSQWSLVCRYDDREQILEKEEFSDLFNDRRRFLYEYDKQCRLDRIILRSEQQGERVYESVRYVADGTKAVTSYPIQLDERQRQTAFVSTDAALHLSLDAAVVVTIFDTHDRPIRKVLYDADDRVIRRIGFCYDSRGLLVEEGELIAGRLREDFRNVYKWDNSGRQTEIFQQRSDGTDLRKIFTYNDRGDVLEESIEQDFGLTGEDGESQNWKQRFSYQYDHHGNWTERRTETISSIEIRLSMIERRELAYF